MKIRALALPPTTPLFFGGHARLFVFGAATRNVNGQRVPKIMVTLKKRRYKKTFLYLQKSRHIFVYSCSYKINTILCKILNIRREKKLTSRVTRREWGKSGDSRKGGRAANGACAKFDTSRFGVSTCTGKCFK